MRVFKKKNKERCQIKKKESVFIYISGDFLFLFLIINNSLIIARAYFLNEDFLKNIFRILFIKCLPTFP